MSSDTWTTSWRQKFEYKEGEKPDLVFVPRMDWAAPAPLWPGGSPEPLVTPVDHVLCVYTTHDTCYKKFDCMDEMLKMFRTSRRRHKYPDIKYNFVIGNDGRVYEGRGWTTRPDFNMETELEKNKTLLIGFTGSKKDDISKKVFAVRDELLLYGIENNYISPTYKLLSAIEKTEELKEENKNGKET